MNTNFPVRVLPLGRPLALHGKGLTTPRDGQEI
jgi:hypothetical protein